VTVLAFSGSEKVAVTLAPVLIFVAPLAGVTLLTVGGVVSDGGAAAVLNDQMFGVAKALPATSVIVPVNMAV